MFDAKMREYDYYILQDKDEYGQQTLSKTPSGKIKMAIFISSQSVQDNILFEGCNYIGLTYNAKVRYAYVIDYKGEKLKILYITPPTARNAPVMAYMTRIAPDLGRIE